MTDLLRRLATGRTVLVALLTAIVVGMLVFLRGPYAEVRRAGGGPLPDERYWQPADLGPWLESLGEAGRATYQRFLVLDAVSMTLVATPAFILLAAWVLLRWFEARPRLILLSLLLLAPAAADLVENLVLFQAAGRYPELAGLPLALGSSATAAKTVLATILHPLTLLGALLCLSMEVGRAAQRRWAR